MYMVRPCVMPGLFLQNASLLEGDQQARAQLTALTASEAAVCQTVQ